MSVVLNESKVVYFRKLLFETIRRPVRFTRYWHSLQQYGIISLRPGL